MTVITFPATAPFMAGDPHDRLIAAIKIATQQIAIASQFLMECDGPMAARASAASCLIDARGNILDALRAYQGGLEEMAGSDPSRVSDAP